LPAAGPGINYYRLPFDLPNARLWDPKTPWLYQAQVVLLDHTGQPVDTFTRQFGMRSFVMDEDGDPKGKFYLNGREIRLRGANTMGFEQLDVMNANWDRLIDDILLAKICNLNFLRLTQRPVQEEVYDFCDRLGLMTQTDLPLFGVIRRNQFVEAVRQAGEMEKLVRSHPCNVLVSFINEPFPNAGGKPHRHLTKPEMQGFFEAAIQAVHIANPDRVIKPVDGDYDPPSPGLPDNHCYTGWYNGHGLDIGKLHKGYWQKVKPGWMYGCGEFGAEGLDPVDTMRKYYPPEWLPRPGEDERKWSPNRIPQAQTGRFHYLWFDTQDTLEDWVYASQNHQARVVRLMAEAFRRDNRMNSFAVHLFIDAWPSGWMKSIMDVDRNPKQAYFAYLDTLNPLIANLRTDRTSFTAGEQICVEAWVCNDTDECPKDALLCYSVERNCKVILAQCTPANIVSCSSSFQGFLRFKAPEVEKREHLVIRLGLVDSSGRTVHDTYIQIEVFPSTGPAQSTVNILSSRNGPALQLAKTLGLRTRRLQSEKPEAVMLIDDVSDYLRKKNLVDKAVADGATALFLELPEGKHMILGREIEVRSCGMGERHFVSRKTGHPLVADFKPDDFAFWYDSRLDRIAPILSSVVLGNELEPILIAGNGDWNSSEWIPCAAVAEFAHGKGRVRLCQLRLSGFVDCNPVARIFGLRLVQSWPTRRE
ncbi:MAG: glycoside hydrolase family 2, partial [Armatimonadetes bacterium]|nr:glycoside hydrolase family 2 [Armatimonadota bacterium]